MAKLKDNFFNLLPEQQAKEIERETAKLIKRLPELKKKLKMHNEVSSELYNLTEEEVSTIGSTYANAVRSGEITTPSSKQAYQKFVKSLRRYARHNINEIAQRITKNRLDSWLETIKNNGSQAEYDYAVELLGKMSEEEKQGFTRSSYFIDNVNWASTQTFVFNTQEGEYSLQVLGLENYLVAHTQIDTNKIYNRLVATDGKVDKKRAGIGKFRGHKRRS